MNESIGGYVLWLVTAIYGFLETAVGWLLLSLLAVLGFGCQQPSAPISIAPSIQTTAIVPIDVELSAGTAPIQIGEPFGVEICLRSAHAPVGIFGAQLCLKWDSTVFVIEGATTYVPYFGDFGGFPGIFGGANDDLTDGEAVYVYLCELPPAIPPRTDVLLATLYCRAIVAGTGMLAIIPTIPSSTLTTRVVNDRAEIVTGTLGNCIIDVQELVGDVNDDGVVDNADLIIVRINRGKPITDENRRCDVNRDGQIDNADMIAVRVKRGNVLP